ncbi:hypothetical protein ASPZODRAFT_93270 [Penicilliopsis zonata CBS 506.65]|uniref:Uncharacterized protein n=1 Tax=Penicilliopsis zonata CBS 506.65 TaxID=1073090 RepID=A0A1L9SN35_9EURO|nr:hypothetical protein ASPZODRAFT_93270 [Penicilliopsis zonata CBS 506.65]OJJ48523.1 hypothetical protein ASPZODRAFT_93270 [Penicilliopsis zonata CBS 506.65]
MTISTQVRRVAVIGAGPSGLSAVKYLLAEKCFDTVDVLEQRSSVGGTWNYCPAAHKQASSTPVPQLRPWEPPEEPLWVAAGSAQKEAVFVSALYERLETNIPKELMKYSDQSWPADTQLFPSHATVLRYLEEYAEDVRDHIRFETQVLDVRVDNPQTSTWAVTTRNLRSGCNSTELYDAVVVASGHYNVPYLPAIEGIETWNKTYPGIISHSKSFDSPEQFRDRKVVVVGNSASGVDIAAQIRGVCKGKLLSSTRSESSFPLSTPSNILQVPEIIEFLPPSKHCRGLRFKDGRIEEDIDAIVFCTGYLYAYPFLSSLEPPVITDGRRTLNVYRQIFYIEHPTLVFPVLPQRVIPFPLSENQAAVFARVWSSRLTLPSKADMHEWENARAAERGDGKTFHLLPFPLDADYLNSLYDWAAQAATRPELDNGGHGKQGIRWEKGERWIRGQLPEIKKAFLAQGEQRHHIRSLKELGFDLETMGGKD